MTHLKALLASSIVAAVLTVALMFVSSGGRIYVSTVDWGQVNSMNYEEGQKYLAERSREITRWDSLKNGIQYPEFWLSALSDWLVYTGVGFVSCLVFRRLAQSNQSPKPTQ